MGWGSGNLGGGSSGLNFKVVAYATEGELLSATPNENTIGVITTTPITALIFSPVKPQSLLDGGVWISTGTSSAVAFNAIKAKKKAILLYPISAMQYVDGTWSDVVAKSYQNGAWIDWWNGELYVSGDEYEAVTGGWVFSHDGEKSGTYMRLGSTSGNLNKDKYVRTVNPIPLDSRNIIEIHFLKGYLQQSTSKLNIEAVDSSGNVAATATVLSGTNKDFSEVTGQLDVSGLTGSYYVQVAIYWTGSVANIEYADIDKAVCK